MFITFKHKQIWENITEIVIRVSMTPNTVELGSLTRPKIRGNPIEPENIATQKKPTQ